MSQRYANGNLNLKRRKQLMQAMGAQSLRLFRAKEHLRNGDVDYRYRPNSDFYYLTVHEPKQLQY
jgi:hypothetical protein